MNSRIQIQIDKLDYLDARVLELNSSHFMDEVTLVYEAEEGNVSIKFNHCYRVIFDHWVGYDKLWASEDWENGKSPYFLQQVKTGQMDYEGVQYHTCKVYMWPATLEIWYKEISIGRIVDAKE